MVAVSTFSSALGNCPKSFPSLQLARPAETRQDVKTQQPRRRTPAPKQPIRYARGLALLALLTFAAPVCTDLTAPTGVDPAVKIEYMGNPALDTASKAKRPGTRGAIQLKVGKTPYNPLVDV